MKIKITTDNSADLPIELYQKYNIETLPIPVILGDEEYTFVDPEQIFSYVKKTNTLPKTAAINECIYGDFFDNILKDYDGIVHISLSGGVSSTCNNAIKASEQRQNVFVIDGKTLSSATGILAIIAGYLNNGQRTAEEIYSQVSKLVDKTYMSFVLEQLDYMKMGGRCNAITLLGANWLKIKPSLILKDSKIIPHKRYKGKQADVLEKYVEFTLEENKDINKEIVFLPHTKGVSDELLLQISSKLKDAGFKNVYSVIASGVITSHCGEGTLGIGFLNN